MRGAILSAVIFAVAAVPAGASTTVLAPPGHSGASQYFETIPTSSGEAAPPGSVSGSGSATGSPSALSQFGHGQRGDSQLARLGANGSAAAALAAATAPAAAVGQQSTAGQPGANTVSSGSGGSVASGISHALTGADGGGLGLALPLLLATALIAALGIAGTALWRRGRPSQPGV